MPSDVVKRFHAALPQVRSWIDAYRQRHAQHARTVDSLGMSRLASYYPTEFLARVKRVTVQHIEFPPVHQFGVPEFAGLQQMRFDGITFMDTYYVAQGQETEALHFHELVHVVQWAQLGADNFLLAYGAGLLQQRYENAPLERMAYSMQAQFERNELIPNLLGEIVLQTDRIWQEAQQVLQ
jgi:hypothetical protein